MNGPEWHPTKTAKKLMSLSDKRDYYTKMGCNEHYYTEEDIKQAIKELKEDDNKILCDLLRKKITIGEAQAKLLQSRTKIFGDDLIK